jgi:hypothetical protein
LLQEPLSFQGFARDPIEQECIYLGAHDLHEIAGKAIASRSVYMEHTDTGIETKCGSRQSGFGFEHGIEIVE